MAKTLQVGLNTSLVSGGGAVNINPTRRGTSLSGSTTRTNTTALSIYYGNAPDLISAFGLYGDGVHDDTTAFNNAITSVSGTGLPAWLQIPAGYNFLVSQLNFPAGAAPITLFGQGSGSLITFTGTPVAGYGRIDIPSGAANITLENFAMEGGVVTPTGYDYSSSPSPIGTSAIATGTSIWAHGTSSGATQKLIFRKLRCNHTGGYFIFVDGTTGNINDVQIQECLNTNSRPTTFGTGSATGYGGWGGGIFYANDGSLYQVTNLLIQGNRFFYCTGNCIWGYSSGLSLLNQDIHIIDNRGYCVGLDFIAGADCSGMVIQGNKCRLVGYVPTADNTVGSPMWLNSGGYNIPAVAYDTDGEALGANYVDNFADAVNGGFIDADGLGGSTVANNTGTSSWASTDSNAQSGTCGPGQGGLNVSYGYNNGNTKNTVNGGAGNVVGPNNFNGFGGGALRNYRARNNKLVANTVNHPSNATYSPITYGPSGYSIGTAGVAHNSTSVSFTSGINFPASASVGDVLTLGGVGYIVASCTTTTATLSTPYLGSTTTVAFIYTPVNQGCTGNEISNNTVYWNPGSAGAVVAEDPTYGAFVPAYVNLVYDNRAIGNSYPVAPNSASGISTAVEIATGTSFGGSGTQIVHRHATEGTSAANIVSKTYSLVGGVGQQESALIRGGGASSVALFGPGTTGSVVATLSTASWASSVATFTIAIWGSGTAYLVGALVVYSGSLYQCTVTNTGSTPSALVDWALYTFPVGGYITVLGVSPSGYNVIGALVTAATVSTVSVALASNPGAYSSGGVLTLTSAGGSIATGPRTNSTIGDAVNSGVIYTDGFLATPTTRSYDYTAKEYAYFSGGANYGLRGNASGWEQCLSAIGGVPQWTALGGTTNYTALSQYDWGFTVGSGVTGSLGSAGANNVTFTGGLPSGVAANSVWVYISGGSGGASEACQITSASGSTIYFTTVNVHTGSWVISSDTRGLMEQLSLPVTNTYPFIINGRSDSTPGYSQTDAAMLIGRNTSDSLLPTTSLARVTLSVHTDYSGALGSASSIYSDMNITNTVAGNSCTTTVSMLFADSISAVGTVAANMIASHAEARIYGLADSSSQNCEGTSLGGTHSGWVSNTGLNFTVPIFTITTCAWASTGGGQATFNYTSPTWSSGVSYNYADMVTGSDGHTYQSTVSGTGSNTGHNPVSTSGYWSRFDNPPGIMGPYSGLTSYINVSGVSPSGYNVNRALVVSVASGSVTVQLPTNPGSTGSGGYLQQSPQYYGGQIFMHHQAYNTGAGLLIRADMNTTAVGLLITSADVVGGGTGLFTRTTQIDALAQFVDTTTTVGHYGVAVEIVQPDGSHNDGPMYRTVKGLGTGSVKSWGFGSQTGSAKQGYCVCEDVDPFSSSGNERFTVLAGGFVGMNQSQPSAPLEVTHTGAESWGIGAYLNQSGTGTDGVRASFGRSSGGSPQYWSVGLQPGSGATGFVVNSGNWPGGSGYGTTQLLCDTSGRWTITGDAANPSLATTAGYIQSAEGFFCNTSGDGLHVKNGVSGSNGYVFVFSSNNMYVAADNDIYLQSGGGSGGNVVLNGTLQVGTIHNSGTLSITTGVDLGSNGLNSGGLTVNSNFQVFSSGNITTNGSIQAVSSILCAGLTSTAGASISGANLSVASGAIILKTSGEIDWGSGNGVLAASGVATLTGITLGTSGSPISGACVINGDTMYTGTVPISTPSGSATMYLQNGWVWKVV